MKTPIGLLAMGSLIKKGGNLMQVIDIDASETVEPGAHRNRARHLLGGPGLALLNHPTDGNAS